MPIRTIFQSGQSAEHGPTTDYIFSSARKVEESTLDAAVKIAADLKDTMRNFDFCVGLAANQINSPLAVCVVKIVDEDSSLVMVNPRVIQLSGKKDKKRESCMSVWGWAGEVERRANVEVEYCDLELQIHSSRFSGYQARIVQHEIDHLEGRLYTDRLSSQMVPAPFFDSRTPIAH